MHSSLRSLHGGRFFGSPVPQRSEDGLLYSLSLRRVVGVGGVDSDRLDLVLTEHGTLKGGRTFHPPRHFLYGRLVLDRVVLDAVAPGVQKFLGAGGQDGG